MSAPAITIYSTPTCGFCYMAKEYLKGRKIAYTEKDLTTDNDALEWVVQKTGQAAVPVLDINGTVIIGFDRPRIDTALREQKLVA